MKLVGLAFLLVASCGGKVIDTSGSDDDSGTGCPSSLSVFQGSDTCHETGGFGQPCRTDGACNFGLTCSSPTALDPNVRCLP
jgi:hypothetical protein